MTPPTLSKQLPVTIIRIDPDGQKLARVTARIGDNQQRNSRTLKGFMRAESIGWRYLEMVDGKKMIVCAGLEADRQAKGFAIRHGENPIDTAGIGLLIGIGEGGGLVDAPVSLEWVRERISWLDGEDIDGNVEHIYSIIGEDLRGPLRLAQTYEPGMGWFLSDSSPVVLDALFNLGISAGKSRRHLTVLGEHLRKRVCQSAAA